jgi:uncharacterized protein
MDRAIRITAGAVSAEARLNESKTAGAIWDALPIEAKGLTWGDEIYLDIGLTAPPEQARDVVDVGDLAYWPPGQAFCIFFGRTPASWGDECRAASPVNVVGKIVGDARVFTKVRSGSRVTIERQ